MTSSKIGSKAWLNASAEWHNKIFISHATWPTMSNSNSVLKYEKMASLYDLKTNFQNSQFTALASIILFTEILTKSGKKVNRASFIEQIQDQRQFETGFIPALSFGPNKRVGSERVFIAKTDLLNRNLILVN